VADKLEVLPGPGLVARFGEVVAWAGPQASQALYSHLANEALRASQLAAGAEALANSLITVLQRGDPEPHVPFAVVGPGSNGLALFLHGPVQAWDSGRWLSPQPVPGWMLTPIGRPWPLIVLAYGAPPPPPSQQGNPFNLVSGVVPGSGFVLLRPDAPGAAAPAGAAQLAQAGPGPGAAVQAGPAPSPAPVPQQVPVPPQGTVPQPAPGAQGPAGAQAPPGGPPVAQAPPMAGAPRPDARPPAPPAGAAAPAVTEGGAIDLRGAPPAPLAPLPRATDPTPLFPRPGQPDVTGTRCDQGHFNHPRASRCLTCGQPIGPGAVQVTGPQPCLGVLLADDGSIWALDQGYVIGAQPEAAPEVQAGLAQALTMRAGPGNTMAPVQAEVQLRGWDVRLVDRGADGGTWAQPPDVGSWGQLGRFEQRDLLSGSHISCGGRVLTFLSAWPA